MTQKNESQAPGEPALQISASPPNSAAVRSSCGCKYRLMPFYFRDNPLWYSFSATLGCVAAAALAYVFALLAFKTLHYIPSLSEALPAIGEVIFTVASTIVPVALLYLVVVKDQPDMSFLRSGLALPTSSRAWLHTVGYAAVAVVLAYVFDYFTGGLVTYQSAAAASSMPGDSASQLSQMVQSQAGFDEAGNYQVQVLSSVGLQQLVYLGLSLVVAPLGEEFVCRGVILPVWRQALLSLNLFIDEALQPIAIGLAVVISAFVFALPHGEGLLSQFFFGLLLAGLYLRTGNIWAGVTAHFMNNALVALLMFI